MSSTMLKSIVSDLREIIIKAVACTIKNQSAITVSLQKKQIRTQEEQVLFIFTTSKYILHNLVLNHLLEHRGLSFLKLEGSNPFIRKESLDCDQLSLSIMKIHKVEMLLSKLSKEEKEQDDFLGWVHQYWIDTSVNELISAKKSKDSSYENEMYYEVLILLDQEQTLYGEYYTPSWVVKYIVDRSIRDYRNNHTCPVEQIKLYDPACGTGNFLIYALDAFLELYRCEHSEWTMDQIMTSILQNNLNGTEIQQDALLIASWNLWIKVVELVHDMDGVAVLKQEDQYVGYLKLIQQNVVLADFLDPRQNTKRYDIVVMNPPFVDTRNMPEMMKVFIKTYYPNNTRNLVAAFIERTLQITRESSVIGFIASDTFKTLVSFKNLRKTLLESTEIESMIELGYGVFEADVSCGIYFLHKERNRKYKTENLNEILFVDARNINMTLSVSEILNQLKEKEKHADRMKQSVFLSYQDHVFLTDMPRYMAWLYEKKECLGLGVHPIAQCRVGIQIGDQEAKYTKHIWDIPKKMLDDKTYVRISKSNRGSFIRDYHDVLLWNQNGEWIKSNPGGMVKNSEFYFKRGLSYNLGGKVFKVRKLPETVLFTQGSSGIFLNPGYEQLEDYLLGVLKSKAVNYFLLQINPTNNTTPNDVKKIPIVLNQEEKMQSIAKISCEIQEAYRYKMQFNSVSEYYQKNSLETFWCGQVEESCEQYLDEMERTDQKIQKLQEELDKQVYELYHITGEEQQKIEDEFRREQEESSEVDCDRRKTKFTRKEKIQLIVLDYLRMIAKRVMLRNNPRVYDRFELEQLVRCEILYSIREQEYGTSETNFYQANPNGDTIIDMLEQSLGTRLSELLENGIRIGFHKLYLSGHGSDDVAEPYLRSKLIATQGKRRECVYWHHSQFLVDFDETAQIKKNQEFLRISEEVYLSKFLKTKDEFYERCMLGLRMEDEEWR